MTNNTLIEKNTQARGAFLHSKSFPFAYRSQNPHIVREICNSFATLRNPSQKMNIVRAIRSRVLHIVRKFTYRSRINLSFAKVASL